MNKITESKILKIIKIALDNRTACSEKYIVKNICFINFSGPLKNFYTKPNLNYHYFLFPL